MSVRKIGAGLSGLLMTLAVGAWTALAQAPSPVGVPQPGGLGLQQAASPVKQQLDSFHDLLLVIITAITLLVLALLIYVMWRFRASKNPVPSRTSHNTVLEVAWTVIPVVILVVIAIPSFQLLYFMDRTPEADMTVKVTGRQWYWSYEYPDHGNIAFDSFMLSEDEVPDPKLRLLEVDNRLVVPVGANVRVLVTASDVIHSWAIPSLGIKKDAVPGRLNETWFRADAEGVFYGQCSEICGTNHGFMPIAVEAVSKERFDAWVAEKTVALNRNEGEPRQLAEEPAAR
ncbi:cytochrome c oxidase subunit II [Rhodospirillum centenum]|uniref:Cytochrome c oxidase subunit 2 n=1 Tax=Rhodospirillum centenum (strain ATCC 51521 / SW) TaxID=414684 RepID=B6IXF5_RHOCS|nr:cytochrome c oxidase subunit II [Rhodospirillum centenum]ACJ00979.1 cytochrome c oxidase, subunit II (Heme/copper-type cytochrome/quinol oxidases) [Rhodospirillum centenum SW]